MASPQILQAGRLLAVETPLGKNVMVINHFSGSESISGLFHYQLDLLAEVGQKISFKDLLGRNITVSLQLAGSKQRYFHGVLGRIAQGRKDDRWVHYQADVYPWLWLLTLRSNCRIFQDKTIPEIIKAIFDEMKATHPEVTYRDALAGDHIKLDYCVQYRETDFNFVSRLMEQEGIFYFFEHEHNKHTLVLADSNNAFKDCPDKSTFNYRSEGGYGEREDTIDEWRTEQQLRPGKYSMRDHHFELPSKMLEVNEPTTVKVGNNDKLEIYDYPGEYAARFNKPDGRLGNVEPEGRKLVRARMEQEEYPGQTFRGSSDIRYFISGHKFSLSKHFQRDGQYVLTRVQYSTAQSPDYLSDHTGDQSYACSFECVSASTPVRPARVTPKPFVQGPQTAVVTVKSGEESWLDKYGRVRVQFFWDREGKNDEKSTCWVRVAQPWAGNQWGAHFWPRVGQEVVVAFLEGDPDQPLIVGSTYNAAQMPPYPLPQSYTRSGIKTRSSKQGGSSDYNELRFEDLKGKEQIFFNAQRDMDERVENDSRGYIGNNRHLIVHKDQHELVENDKHGHVKNNHMEKVDKDCSVEVGANRMEKIGTDMSIEVGSNRMEKVGSDMSLEVGSNCMEKIGSNMSLEVGSDCKQKVGSNLSLTVGQANQEKVGTKYAVDAGQEIHLKGGMKVIIEAGMQLSLKAAGGFVDIGPAGVTIQGIMVKINSGGSAGSGGGSSPSSPDAPKAPKPPVAPVDPDTADDGTKFDKM
jgi:type VI secretion system secreted protein VgrG